MVFLGKKCVSYIRLTYFKNEFFSSVYYSFDISIMQSLEIDRTYISHSHKHIKVTMKDLGMCVMDEM